MDADRFDDLLRGLSRTPTRRAALRALAGVALGSAFGAAGPAAATTCGPCLKKQQHERRCRPAPIGAACGDGGTCCHGQVCCPKEQACHDGVCGACPAGDLCKKHSPIALCGRYSAAPHDKCACLTSVDGANVCTSLFAECVQCASDEECAIWFGAPALCVDFKACQLCTGRHGWDDTGGRVCLMAGCEDFSDVVVTTGSGSSHALQRLPVT